MGRLRVSAEWLETAGHAWDTLLLLFFIGAGLAVLTGQFATLPLFFAAVALVVCRVVARARRAGGRAHGPAYHLCATGVLYLTPITIALTVWVGLAVAVRVNRDVLPVPSLIAIQHGFEATSAFFAEHVKMSESAVFWVLLGTYPVTCLLLARGPWSVAGGRRTGRERIVSSMRRAVRLYTRYSGPIAAGLATLASCTLFGLHLGPPTEDLTLRLKSAQAGFADVQRAVQAELSERVTVRAAARLRSGLADGVGSPTFSGPLDSRFETLRTAADDAAVEHGVHDPDADALLAERQALLDRLASPSGAIVVDGPTPPRSLDALTPRQVDAAARAVHEADRDGRIDLLHDGRRELTLQIEKVVSEQLVELTRSWVAAVPGLDPLVQGLVEALDSSVQERMAAAYDRCLDVALHDPAGLNAALDAEAGQVADSVDVDRIARRLAPLAAAEVAREHATLDRVARAQAAVDREVAAVERETTANPLDSPLLDPGALSDNLARMQDRLNRTPIVPPYPSDPRYTAGGSGRLTSPGDRPGGVGERPAPARPPRIVPRFFG